MKFFRGVLKKKIKNEHPYYKLDMGLIKEYSMIIPKAELLEWTTKGWLEDKHFRDFNYYPAADQTIILGKPTTILDIKLEKLIGKQIIGSSSYLGSYGMGGPGFFGILIERNGMEEYLTYAVWASGQYIMMDDRVFECHLKYNNSYRPWISKWAGESEENQWDELSHILNGSIITGILLNETELKIEILSNEVNHNITFYTYKDTLPPLGNGEARKPAFTEGTIGKYIVFCNKNAVLHV